MCVQSGRLNYLIELLAKNPKGVNISDEVSIVGSALVVPVSHTGI